MFELSEFFEIVFVVLWDGFEVIIVKKKNADLWEVGIF